jgi:signal transduction histidine kinase
LLAEGYRIPQGKGLVGRAAATNTVVLIPDVSQDEGWLSHPLLPDTRAEMAVPITRGEQMLGVLDVQRDVLGGLGQADVELLRTVAGQVSIALQNVAFVEEIQAASERLREADRLKNTFMSSMSHELRTPLNSIIGFSEVLLMGISGDLPDEAQADVQAILDNGNHLLGIINDLLDLAKVESGSLELYPEPIEVAALFEDVRANNAGLLVDKPVDMLVQLQDDLPPLQADPIRIKQVLNNLVSNAAKFTDEGRITLRAYSADEWLCLEVQDTGVGIHADDLDRVFERFQQTDKDRARSAKGTGLGLDITRQLVELHGGAITVRSELGKGSTFCVRLPIEAE